MINRRCKMTKQRWNILHCFYCWIIWDNFCVFKILLFNFLLLTPSVFCTYCSNAKTAAEIYLLSILIISIIHAGILADLSLTCWVSLSLIFSLYKILIWNWVLVWEKFFWVYFALCIFSTFGFFSFSCSSLL